MLTPHSGQVVHFQAHRQAGRFCLVSLEQVEMKFDPLGDSTPIEGCSCQGILTALVNVAMVHVPRDPFLRLIYALPGAGALVPLHLHFPVCLHLPSVLLTLG